MPRYRRNPQTAGRVIDGLAFVVTPDDNKLHTLNGSATKLWELANGKGLTIEIVAKALVTNYQVDDETACRDAQDCLDDLRKGLSIELAARALVKAYKVDDETARRDAQDCLDDLVARTILVLEPA